jgi:hypothetical protein
MTFCKMGEHFQDPFLLCLLCKTIFQGTFSLELFTLDALSQPGSAPHKCTEIARAFLESP